jgi:hypothetical protein
MIVSNSREMEYNNTLQLLGYGVDDRGIVVLFPAETIYILFSGTSRPLMGPAKPPFIGYRRLFFPEVKQTWRESDQ